MNQGDALEELLEEIKVSYANIGRLIILAESFSALVASSRERLSLVPRNNSSDMVEKTVHNLRLRDIKDDGD